MYLNINIIFPKIIAFRNKNIKEPKKFICPFKNCQKMYSLKNILLAHLRTHYKIKPFICSYCNKSFNEKGNLKTHIRIHTGERPFKCKKCQKGFKALGQLKDHLISHTGFKPFQCPHCKKFYRRKEILKNHVIIHEKEPYFQEHKEKFQEILNHVKKMKNIIVDSVKSSYISKSNSNENIFNCTISLNEIKNNAIKINNEKINMEENNKNNLVNKINLNNDFLINPLLFKDDYYLDWPNSLSSLNDIMSSTADASLKEENNNIDNCSNNFENENPDNITGKEINNFNIYSNDILEQNIDLYNKEDCCSKMTNLYVQEFEDKKFDFLLE